MAEAFDLIVIGTGTAGGAVASRCRNAGWRVAIVDELPYGGTCALRGCDPKKVLVGGAELTDWNRRMRGRGIVGETEISWPDLMRFKRTFTDPVPAARQQAFAKAGIATYCGPARFVGAERLSVDGQVLEARHFVIAAGAKPRRLGIPGEEHLVTGTQTTAGSRAWCSRSPRSRASASRKLKGGHRHSISALRPRTLLVGIPTGAWEKPPPCSR